jgi:hypothetical protein
MDDGRQPCRDDVSVHVPMEPLWCAPYVCFVGMCRRYGGMSLPMYLSMEVPLSPSLDPYTATSMEYRDIHGGTYLSIDTTPYTTYHRPETTSSIYDYTIDEYIHTLYLYTRYTRYVYIDSLCIECLDSRCMEGALDVYALDTRILLHRRVRTTSLHVTNAPSRMTSRDLFHTYVYAMLHTRRSPIRPREVSRRGRPQRWSVLERFGNREDLRASHGGVKVEDPMAGSGGE